MSHSYNARFPATALALPELLGRLEPCLSQARIRFDQQYVRVSSRGGVPIVGTLASEGAATLSAVATRAQLWWGVSLYAISEPLAEELGKSDAIEVYLRAYKAEAGGRLLVYSESSGAAHTRAESDELTADLAAFLTCACAALGLPLAVYAEEDERPTAPTLGEVERRLAAQSTCATPRIWLAVVDSDAMSFDRARELAGPWAHRLRLASGGYVVLPFLGGTPAPRAVRITNP